MTNPEKDTGKVGPEPVTVVRLLPVALSAAWRLLTDPTLLSIWLAPCARSSGDTVTFSFSEPEGIRTKVATVIDCHPPGDVAVTWADPGYPTSVIALFLQSPSGQRYTRVTLVHTDVPISLVDGYRSGWSDYFDRLEEVAREQD